MSVAFVDINIISQPSYQSEESKLEKRIVDALATDRFVSDVLLMLVESRPHSPHSP